MRRASCHLALRMKSRLIIGFVLVFAGSLSAHDGIDRPNASKGSFSF